MRSTVLLLSLGCLAACASAPRIVNTMNDTVTPVPMVADVLVKADVVALGELHNTPGVHKVHHRLLEELHRRNPNMVIAMEMFERDVQTELLQYLNGLIDEETFLSKSRPWDHYKRDYRPVIEFAKKNSLVVLAANAPRPLASKAAKKGMSSVAGEKHLARETSAPQDDYWDAFCVMMDGHSGMLGPGGMERYYASQCLKDDTMAESITDYLQRFADGSRPLAVLICGRAHSDHGWGTVQRIKDRMPGLSVRVLSAETVKDMRAGLYESERDVADYVIVAPENVRAKRALPAKPSTSKSVDPGAVAKGEAGEAGEGELPLENPEGMKPAFGFMPDYAGEDVKGVGVGPVREGGPAEAAGIEEGDVIVAVMGIPTPDIEMYSEVLNELLIGRTVTVRVQRGEAEVDLQVEVGSRSGG